MRKFLLEGGIDGHVDHVPFRWEGTNLQDGLEEFWRSVRDLQADFYTLKLWELSSDGTKVYKGEIL